MTPSLPSSSQSYHFENISYATFVELRTLLTLNPHSKPMGQVLYDPILQMTKLRLQEFSNLPNTTQL